MDIKFYKYLCAVLGLFAAFVLISAYSAKPAGATEVPPKCWEEEVPEEPTCEELQNCEEEEPPVVVPEEPKKDAPKGNLKISQGPNGHLGDGCFQVEWKKFKGYDKVLLKFTTDLDGLVFGKAEKRKLDDDGAETICVPGASRAYAKLKPNDDDAEYSSVRRFSF